MNYATAKAIAAQYAPSLLVDDQHPQMPDMLVVRKTAGGHPHSITLISLDPARYQDIPARDAVPAQAAIPASADHPGTPAIPAQPAVAADATQTAPAAATPPVPAHIIPASLPHPNIQGGVLARGVKYLHHFEILLISDGQRLWDAASDEGKKVLADIEGEKAAAHDAIAAAKAAQPKPEEGVAAQTGAGGTDAANPANGDPNVKPAQ
jgi:hypothetical protein